MAFLDEEEAVAPSGSGGGRPPYRRVPDKQRQILVRRAIGLGLLVLILILLVLGIKGCLNARKQRNFENYASDLTAIVTQTQQLSKSFFQQLRYDNYDRYFSAKGIKFQRLISPGDGVEIA